MTASSNTPNFRGEHRGRGQKLWGHFAFQWHPQHPVLCLLRILSAFATPRAPCPQHPEPQFGFPAKPHSAASVMISSLSSTEKSSYVCIYFCLLIPPSLHSRLVTTTCHFLPFSSLGHDKWHMVNDGKPRHKHPPAADIQISQHLKVWFFLFFWS